MRHIYAHYIEKSACKGHWTNSEANKESRGLSLPLTRDGTNIKLNYSITNSYTAQFIKIICNLY